MVTDVSGHPIVPNFKVKAVKKTPFAHLSYIASQKNEGLIYTAEEA
jgi:hypothetical protein